MRGPPIKVPRPVRWLMVLLAVGAGWAAGNLLDGSAARRGEERNSTPVPPTSRPSTMPAGR